MSQEQVYSHQQLKVNKAESKYAHYKSKRSMETGFPVGVRNLVFFNNPGGGVYDPTAVDYQNLTSVSKGVGHMVVHYLSVSIQLVGQSVTDPAKTSEAISALVNDGLVRFKIEKKENIEVDLDMILKPEVIVSANTGVTPTSGVMSGLNGIPYFLPPEYRPILHDGQSFVYEIETNLQIQTNADIYLIAKFGGPWNEKDPTR